jgi:hypothetical protein
MANTGAGRMIYGPDPQKWRRDVGSLLQQAIKFRGDADDESMALLREEIGIRAVAASLTRIMEGSAEVDTSIYLGAIKEMRRLYQPAEDDEHFAKLAQLEQKKPSVTVKSAYPRGFQQVFTGLDL